MKPNTENTDAVALVYFGTLNTFKQSVSQFKNEYPIFRSSGTNPQANG